MGNEINTSKLIGQLEELLWKNGYDNELSREHSIDPKNNTGHVVFTTDGDDDMLCSFNFNQVGEKFEFSNIRIC